MSIAEKLKEKLEAKQTEEEARRLEQPEEVLKSLNLDEWAKEIAKVLDLGLEVGRSKKRVLIGQSEETSRYVVVPSVTYTFWKSYTEFFQIKVSVVEGEIRREINAHNTWNGVGEDYFNNDDNMAFLIWKAYEDPSCVRFKFLSRLWKGFLSFGHWEPSLS